MILEKIENFSVPSNSIVKVTEMGNITEIMYLSRKNFKPTIKKISKQEFIVLSTGEKKEFVSTVNRSEGKDSVRRTLRKLRNLLNANIIDVSTCRWITLTYAENMTDTVRLYEDFKKFNKRMKYHFNKQNIDYEYIVAMEPQGRGAWHCHLVMIFDCKAPYMSNQVPKIYNKKLSWKENYDLIVNHPDFDSDLFTLWGHGFVTVKKLDDVDNVGAYLTAYLGDMEVGEAFSTGIDINGLECKEIEYKDDKGILDKKYYVKGARLTMYPPGFNLYRASRGVKKPVEYETDNKTATKKASVGALTFNKTVYLELDDGFNTIIAKRYYNKKRMQNQGCEKAHDNEPNNISNKPTFKDEVNYAKGRQATTPCIPILDNNNITDYIFDRQAINSWIPMYDAETGEIYKTPFDE